MGALIIVPLIRSLGKMFVFDTLAGSVWFSKVDANAAYWQIRVAKEDHHKTAFITKYGLYEHVKMGFGLCNAPATYSRVMNLVLKRPEDGACVFWMIRWC